jgi:hypothetical protein
VSVTMSQTSESSRPVPLVFELSALELAVPQPFGEGVVLHTVVSVIHPEDKIGIL